jgi:hypothetical protein
MMMRDLKWSKTEKQIAKKAFEKAYEQESSDLAEEIRSRAEKIKEPAGIWHLKDFVNKRVREIGNRYDYPGSRRPRPLAVDGRCMPFA